MRPATALNRRAWLARIATAAALGVAWRSPLAGAPAQRFAAAWENAGGAWRVGVLATGQTLTPQAQTEVPTRAHGLLVQPGALLAVARRPGDWLMRWDGHTGHTQWGWIEVDRAFNGHLVASVDGRRIYTTETDLDTGAGLIGVRDARSLDKLAEWPSGGMDPHELLLDADGSLLVANGGLPSLPETGRLKTGLAQMDASLVRMDSVGGQLRGQWRLADRRLSLRHMAWGRHAGTAVLGIALQAEHEEALQRQQAPLLALFDGRQLQLAPAPQPLAGYGGAIAFSAGRFAVSCPRAQGVALYGPDGRWLGFVPLREACPLAASADLLWAGGAGQSLALLPGPALDTRPTGLPAGLRLDNHWLALAPHAMPLRSVPETASPDRSG